jgi:hypothetical protein
VLSSATFPSHICAERDADADAIRGANRCGRRTPRCFMVNAAGERHA